MIQYDGDYSVESMSRLSRVIKVKRGKFFCVSSALVWCVKSKLISNSLSLFISPQFEFIIQNTDEAAMSASKKIYKFYILKCVWWRSGNYSNSFLLIHTFQLYFLYHFQLSSPPRTRHGLNSIYVPCGVRNEFWIVYNSLFLFFDHKLNENVGNWEEKSSFAEWIF